MSIFKSRYLLCFGIVQCKNVFDDNLFMNYVNVFAGIINYLSFFNR